VEPLLLTWREPSFIVVGRVCLKTRCRQVAPWLSSYQADWQQKDLGVGGIDDSGHEE